MENRSYRPEDIRYYDSDSSSSSEFYGFDVSDADPNRPPSPPPPPIRPNADELPLSELNISELTARIRRGHEERIAYWNPSPSDPPLRRPMRAPGSLENYIDVTQVDFPERLAHDGAGLRDLGFRPPSDGVEASDPASKDDQDDRDDEERAMWREFRERLQAKKRERRRRYKESCRARGKSLSKKKSAKKSVANEQLEEKDVPPRESFVEEDWELEIAQEMAAMETIESQPLVDAEMPPAAPADVVMSAPDADLNNNMDISENIEGSQRILAEHEAFMKELQDFYGGPEVEGSLVLDPPVAKSPARPITDLLNPFPALNEPDLTAVNPRVLEGQVRATSTAVSTITSPCEEEGLAGVVVGPVLADQPPALKNTIEEDPAVLFAVVEVKAAASSGDESAGTPPAPTADSIIEILPKEPVPLEQLTDVVAGPMLATLPLVPDEPVPIVDLPNGLVFEDEPEEEAEEVGPASFSIVEVENPQAKDTETVTQEINSFPPGESVDATGPESACLRPDATEETMEEQSKEVAPPLVLMDVDLPPNLPDPDLSPKVADVAEAVPPTTPPSTPRSSPPRSPPPCVPVPPPAPAAPAVPPGTAAAVEEEIAPPAPNPPVPEGAEEEQVQANEGRRGRARRREAVEARPVRPRQPRHPLPRRPRPGDRHDRRERPPPYPILPTWGHVNQQELLRIQGDDGRVGRLRTRRRRQSRARKALRDQGVAPEMLYFHYEWHNRNGRRRRV